jgi:hypothetical protein
MPIDAVAKLKQACDEAYDKYPEYCNQSTCSVLRAMIDPKWPKELADDMIDRVVNAGWKTVTDNEAADLANQGKVVVAGLKAETNGHILVVYPGPMKQMNGFACNGTFYKPSGEPMPLAMSTSKSPWCGTRSKGDKTIRDAWSKTDWPKVQRWCQP